MSYELLRTQLAARLSCRLPVELLHDLLQELDMVAVDYDIKRSCTDLTVAGGLPEPVRMYIAAMAVENKSKATLDNYLGILRTFFSRVNKSINVITTNDIRTFLWSYEKERGISKNTLEHMRVVINAFYSWCHDEELITRNPAKRVERIAVPKHEREPIEQIELEYLRKACRNKREKALVDFLYSTGCRISECAALVMADIDFRDRSVRIRHGKGDKARTTYFNAEAEVSLREYLQKRRFPSNAVFASHRSPHGNVSAHALRDEVRKIRKRTNNISRPVTPHVLRHTFATTLIGNGTPVEHVQKLLGHASLDTTMIYAKLDQQDVRNSHSKRLA